MQLVYSRFCNDLINVMIIEHVLNRRGSEGDGMKRPFIYGLHYRVAVDQLPGNYLAIAAKGRCGQKYEPGIRVML